MRRVLRSAARLCLAGVFVSGGWNVLRNPGPRAELVRKAGLPREEELLCFNAAAQLAGAAGLVSGILRRPAAAGLSLSLLATSYVGHPFWTLEDPKQRAMHQVHFFKNVAILGGLVYVATEED